jgi:hypothetical protein
MVWVVLGQGMYMNDLLSYLEVLIGVRIIPVA